MMPSRLMPTEQSWKRLAIRLRCAVGLQMAFTLAIIVPVAFAVRRSVSFDDTEHDGWLGLVFGLKILLWAPAIIFFITGFFLSNAWRRSLRRRMDYLERQRNSEP